MAIVNNSQRLETSNGEMMRRNVRVARWAHMTETCADVGGDGVISTLPYRTVPCGVRGQY